MITGTVRDALYNNVVQTITYQGFEAPVGLIIGVLIAMLAWDIFATMKVS